MHQHRNCSTRDLTAQKFPILVPRTRCVSQLPSEVSQVFLEMCTLVQDVNSKAQSDLNETCLNYIFVRQGRFKSGQFKEDGIF